MTGRGWRALGLDRSRVVRYVLPFVVGATIIAAVLGSPEVRDVIENPAKDGARPGPDDHILRIEDPTSAHTGTALIACPSCCAREP